MLKKLGWNSLQKASLWVKCKTKQIVCVFKKTSSKIYSQGPPLKTMKNVLFHYKNMYFIEYEIKDPFNYDEAVCQHGC